MTIDAIDRLLRQANPIPDPMQVELTDLEPDTVIDIDIGFRAETGSPSSRRSGQLADLAEPLPGARGERTQRRRWHIVAAAAAAIALVAVGALVRAATDDRDQTQRPADSTSPTTTPTPRGGATELPPAGATPSTPERGELVASIVPLGVPNGIGEGSFNLFADGRLIRNGTALPDTVDHSLVVEQRLTPEGVERVRSEFLATGLFDPDPAAPNAALASCGCVLRVRDGGRLLSSDDPTADYPSRVDPGVDRQIDRLVDHVVGLDAWLPPNAWAAREISPYVPARYSACIGEYTQSDPHPMPDPVAVLAQRVPPPVAQLFAGADPCVVLTLHDARRLAEALDDARTRHGYLPAWFSGPTGLSYRFYADRSSDVLLGIDLAMLLPDGQPPMTAGS